MRVVLLYSAGWFGMVSLAIFNGVIREKLYGPVMRELTAHQLSTLICIFLFGAYIWILTGIWRIKSPKQAILIGGIWLIMTIMFEFIFGHYVLKNRWGKLFHDYNLIRGRIWLLVLIWISIAPYTFYRIWT